MIRAGLTPFHFIVIGLLISGLVGLYGLIRRRRFVSSACLLGASVGGGMAILIAVQFPEQVLRLAELWYRFMTSIGLQGVVNFFRPLLVWVIHSLVVGPGMAVGAGIG